VKSPIPAPPAAPDRHRVRVGYVDTDRAGVVHHAAYLGWMEAARIEHQRARGLVYRDFELETGLALPVVEAHLRYRTPARFDDELVVESWVIEAGRAKVVYAQRVMRGDAVLVEGRVVLACVDMKEERIASMPERILSACAR
jgi:acyl-CoA thioester hydrolase